VTARGATMLAGGPQVPAKSKAEALTPPTTEAIAKLAAALVEADEAVDALAGKLRTARVDRNWAKFRLAQAVKRGWV
jgi:hypothetical protein